MVHYSGNPSHDISPGCCWAPKHVDLVRCSSVSAAHVLLCGLWPVCSAERGSTIQGGGEMLCTLLDRLYAAMIRQLYSRHPDTTMWRCRLSNYQRSTPKIKTRHSHRHFSPHNKHPHKKQRKHRRFTAITEMSLVSMAQKTQTVTKTAIDVAQSQKLIHTMLGMSFGCVAFLRGIFPDDNFTDQRFIPRKFEKDYNPGDPSMRTDALKVKTLVRGKSPQVDQFLNWLDMGVVDALRKGLLKSLILGIFLDENKPEVLHEVYTFSFDYTGNKIKLEMSQGDTEVVTLLNARQTLQHVMRRLIVVTQGLSLLPEKKFLTMRMLFNDSCPKEYQPPGFKDASDTPPAVIKTKKRNFESFTAGDISTGRHESVSYFESSSPFQYVFTVH